MFGGDDIVKQVLEFNRRNSAPQVPLLPAAGEPTQVSPPPGWALPSLSAKSQSLSHIVKPDRSQAERYASLVFHGAHGFVNLRAIEEPAPKDRAPIIRQAWLPIDDALPASIGQYVEDCARDGLAAYLIPAPVRQGGGGLDDLLSSRFLIADIDSGDVASKVGAMDALLGEPTLVVSSGGVTESGRPKVHVYYRIAEDVAPSDFATLAAARKRFAELFGADLKVGRNPAQILRCPGSVHAKGAPTLARLSYAGGATYALSELAAKLTVSKPTANADNYFDFSADRPTPSVERALTQPILSEGRSKDGLTRFDGASQALGHFIRMVREGRYSLDEAWEAAKGWNQAILVPPWDEARLRNDFERLNRIDHETHGPIVPPIFLPTVEAADWQFSDWNARRFKGPAPKREWLVDNLIPKGVPGVFGAVGDAGKSMMALKLAHVVGCYPPSVADANGPAGINDTPSFFGKPIVGRGTAIVLTGEDDEAEVHRRLEIIDPNGLRLRDSARLIVLPLISAGGARAIVADTKLGPQPTPFWTDLRAKLLAVPDLALVVLDPLAHFLGADMNDNTAGAMMMAELGKLAAETGATFLLIHHLNKGGKITGLSDARGAVLGAGAWVNNSRFALVMWEADEDAAYKALKLLGREPTQAVPAGVVYQGGITKSNAPAEKMLRTLARNPATGILDDVTDALRAAAPKQYERDDAAYAALLKQAGQDPRFAFGSGEGSLWKAWHPVFVEHSVRVTRKEVQPLFDRLLEQRRLVQTDQKLGGYIQYAIRVD